MTCSDFDQFLYPYLDGELIGSERTEIERHLGECPPCAQKISHEAQLQSVLKERLKGVTVPAPSGLRRTITQGIQADRRRERLVQWGRWTALAASAALLAGVTWELRPNLRNRLMEDAALRHARRLPYEVQAGSPGKLEAWFDGKLDYPVPVPKLGNATLAGARLSNLTDHDAAYIGYQAGGPDGAERRLGLFVLDDSDDEFPAAVWPSFDVREVHGYRVAAWRNGQIVYELVSDLDEPDLRRLLRGQAQPQPVLSLPTVYGAARTQPAGQVIPAALRQ